MKGPDALRLAQAHDPWRSNVLVGPALWDATAQERFRDVFGEKVLTNFE